MPVADACAIAWRKSSACLPSDCVEVATTDGQVLIRDSADKAGGCVLMFRGDQWSVFVQHLRREHVQYCKRELHLN
jgi:hypothetical protein